MRPRNPVLRWRTNAQVAGQLAPPMRWEPSGLEIAGDSCIRLPAMRQSGGVTSPPYDRWIIDCMTTMRDIAERSGVSVCTVSRILSSGTGRERFSEDCRRRVREAAQALNYSPNHAAQSLRTGATGIVVFAVNWAPSAGGNAFQAALIMACEAAVRQRGLHLLVVGGGRDGSATRELLKLAARRQCDGIIAVSSQVNRTDVNALIASGTPLSFLGNVPRRARVGAEIDDEAGVSAAVQHLAALGHRCLIWIEEHGNGPTIRARRSGFDSVCAQLGLDGRRLTLPPVPDMCDQARIGHTCSSLLARRDELSDRTALICYNDLLAIGAYAALAELGRRPPSQVSIVGFDDVHAATALPAMTTIDHELPALAEAALAALYGGPRYTLITPRLLVRDSTGPAPVQLRR
jgi:LacI family repressor for deo operon, udp, cdd, tsx, nupC, and nupG